MSLSREEKLELYRTYSSSFGEYTLSIVPPETGGSSWRVWIWSSGVRGPVFQGNELTEEWAEEIGVSDELRQDINDAVEVFNENVQPPAYVPGGEREGTNIENLIEKAREIIS